MATYTIRTTSVQDWRDTMMSKAEFNALAAERRANRAGSGFDEFGKHYLTAGSSINEGLWVNTTIVASIANILKLGRGISDGGVGSSKTDYALSVINGISHVTKNINSIYTENTILLPPAPTILPSTATLTQQQIDSGVIKHADTSNSGLIVNGKFDTDTSGWTLTNGAIFSANALSFATTTSGAQQNNSNVVVGKQYIVEFNVSAYTSGTQIWVRVGGSAYSVIPVTGTGRFQTTITATNSSETVFIYSGGSFIGSIDNIAVFPADAISRSDLVFLESWHEDVSEKDFVYPLGNVQYLGTTGDSGTPVAGAFAGAATYSLFSDIWQADSALVGKGYVWSTLSDANKKAFVADPDNNCYLDGDKVIQVRYRIRVVIGLGDTWSKTGASYDPQIARYLGYKDATNYYIIPKGKKTEVVDYGASTLSLFEGNFITKTTVESEGVYKSVIGTPINIAYEGKCYALPIALVYRRNQGGYNLTYNPHGTKTMTMTPTSIADCFTEANYTATTGYIGTSTSRPDGLFYDEVSVEDFKPSNKGADLRNSSKKLTAHQIIQEFAPKAITGTIPYFNNDTTALTTYKDDMEVRDTSGNRYGMVSKVGNVVTIGATVANKKGFSVVTSNGKQFLQVADDATSDTTVQMNLSTIKYDIGVFDA